MAELGNLALLFAIGIPGWLLFRKLRMPGAPILGAMLAVGTFQIAGFGPGQLPAIFKPTLQIVVGMVIGLRVRPDIRHQLRGMLPVAALVSAWWLVVALGGGYLLFIATQLDLKTALLGSTPGGISEMSLLALHFGADAPAVALLQFFRVTLVLVGVPLTAPRLYPFLERLGGGGRYRKESVVAPAPCASGGGGNGGGCNAGPTVAPPSRPPAAIPVAACPKWLLYGRTIAVATLGGLALETAGFPAGGLVGSMLAVGALRAAGVACGSFHEDVRCLAQVGLGGLIGLGFSATMLQSLTLMVAPVILLTTVMLSFGFALAILVHRMTGWDIRTCVLATCAGGLTQIGAVAEELGGNPVTVTILHVVRLITIVSVLPPVFSLLFNS